MKKSQMTIQSSNNNLNYLIDPTFTKLNKLFACHSQETIKETIKILFYILMFQMLK